MASIDPITVYINGQAVPVQNITITSTSTGTTFQGTAFQGNTNSYTLQGTPTWYDCNTEGHSINELSVYTANCFIGLCEKCGLAIRIRLNAEDALLVQVKALMSVLAEDKPDLETTHLGPLLPFLGDLQRQLLQQEQALDEARSLLKIARSRLSRRLAEADRT